MLLSVGEILCRHLPKVVGQGGRRLPPGVSPSAQSRHVLSHFGPSKQHHQLQKGNNHTERAHYQFKQAVC